MIASWAATMQILCRLRMCNMKITVVTPMPKSNILIYHPVTQHVEMIRRLARSVPVISCKRRFHDSSRDDILIGGLGHLDYFSIQLGMSWSQLTKSIIFQRGRAQAPSSISDHRETMGASYPQLHRWKMEPGNPSRPKSTWTVSRRVSTTWGAAVEVKKDCNVDPHKLGYHP